MEENLLEIDGGSLDCDNEGCGYSDPSIPISDYEKCIGMPCPKCGQSLLTQEDYNTFIGVLELARLANEMAAGIGGGSQDDEKVTIGVKVHNGVSIQSISDTLPQ